MTKDKISHEELIQILNYDQDTGIFYWKVTHHRIKKGDIAGSLSGDKKYIQIRIKRKLYYAHVLAYFYITKEWPVKVIDHIDGHGLNNSFNNLRSVTQKENSMNRVPNKNSKSGYKNIAWLDSLKKWRVKFKVNGKDIHIGVFDDLEMAKAIASEYRDKYHGKYACHKLNNGA